MGVKIGGTVYVIPEHMLISIERYVNQGVPVGDFLQAFIANDLMDAVGRADHINIHLFPAYANLFHFEAPDACHGSRQAYRDWLDTGGLKGMGFKEMSFVRFSDQNS